jgi:hypothetical protein
MSYTVVMLDKQEMGAKTRLTALRDPRSSLLLANGMASASSQRSGACPRVPCACLVSDSLSPAHHTQSCAS